MGRKWLALVHVASLLLFVALFPVYARAAEKARQVTITFTMDPSADNPLSVEVVTAGKGGKPPDHREITGPDAFGFRLRPGDRVTLVLTWKAKDEQEGDILYAITGGTVGDKDLDQLKKFVGAATSKTEQGKVVKAGARPRQVVKVVTDDLAPGGKLTITFNVVEPPATAGTSAIVATSGPLTFRVDSEPPRFTVSTGLALSNAPEPTVALIKTNKIVTFEKDGKTQQAYEQVIVLRDSETTMQPIQSLATAANFRFCSRVYGTLGFQLNQDLFEEPIVGITYRHPLGAIGLNVTAGIHFSRETEIDPESGFYTGMPIDPTLGLTVDDIPTRVRYHRRVALVFSVDF